MQSFHVRDLLVSVLPGTQGWSDDGLSAADAPKEPAPDPKKKCLATLGDVKKCPAGGSVTRTDPGPCRSTTDGEPACKAGGSVTTPIVKTLGEGGVESYVLDALRADLENALRAQGDGPDA